MGANVFDFPKDESTLRKFIEMATDPADENCIALDFFAGSGTTAEAVMRLNAEDGGQRQFILVQIPQPIDARKQKDAYDFVTTTLGKAEPTIFDITAERIRRAGAQLAAQQPQLDTGFRVFDLVDDPDALILQKPLAEATQDDLTRYQQAIATPQPALIPRVLCNLLLAEGLPLSTKIHEIRPKALYSAREVLLILQAVEVDEVRAAWQAAQAHGQPLTHLSVFAPWVQDNDFLQSLDTLALTLDLSADRLRLRG